MDFKHQILKIGYELVIIINGVALLLWILLTLFPGLNDIGVGNIISRIEGIFVDFWFFMFVCTLLLGIIFRKFLGTNDKLNIE
ncbi:MAG: hypothetical protein ACTSRL_03120 [Candidatus Helarchaeota archaeon]